MSRFISTKGMKISDWRKLRDNFLGASEISAAVGLNPYRSGLDLWREKTKDPSYTPFTGNSYTKWGTRLESAIAWGFANDYKLKIRRDHKLRIHDNDILSCSLDRIIIRGNSTGTLEIKNMSEKQFSRLVLDTNDVSMMHFSQVQQQFAVSGMKWGYFVILVGGNTLIVKKIKPDNKFIKMQNELGVEWWNRFVLQKKPPDVTSTLIQAIKDRIRDSKEWQHFNFTAERDPEETDPIKIYIRQIEATQNRTELKELIAKKYRILNDASKDNQALITTVIKIQQMKLRK
jgi:putative phage-type endonuclease